MLECAKYAKYWWISGMLVWSRYSQSLRRILMKCWNLDRVGNLLLPNKYFLMKFLKTIRTVRLKYYILEVCQWCEVQSPLLDTYLLIMTKYLYEWTRYLKMSALPLERSAFHGCSFRHFRVMTQCSYAQKFAKFLVDLGKYSRGS